MFNSKIQQHGKNKMRKRCRLFHATDFQSLMYPCFILCRILGICPYKINAMTFTISKPYYILSTIIICGFCIYDLVLIYAISSAKVTYENIIKNLESVCYCTFTGLIAIITYILSSPRMRLLQSTLEISSKLSSKSYQKLSRLIHAKDIFVFIWLIVQGNIYYYKILATELNYFYILYIVFGMYITLFEFEILMLYVNCVCVLKTCFKSINSMLAHMQKFINCISPSLICHARKNQSLLIKLKSLMKQHLKTSKIMQMLNIIFSLQILATVVMVFANITFELYLYAVRWQDGITIVFNKHLLDIFSMSLTYNVVRLIILVWICETCKNQAQEIRTIIHDLLNNTSNEEIKDEVHT
ncbi:uncharacterized protein LOC105832291 [Monomorium pharaonis]|uniref:uncharacterized protein LOC105832291 n=1 Tax=Monomorium pharaonis TaxID=307658 RepID=UPI00102E1F2C|nr:uncharacterized protein LOC105832291 [Monomorium pharaonis]